MVDAADPSVVRIKGGYVVVSTGTRVPVATSANGLQFTTRGTALVRRPAWARAGDMWASDIAAHRGRWLLFFAASVPGLKDSSHCIGVAVSASPTGPFTPNDERPLVCPPSPMVPAAEDQYVDLAQPVQPAPPASATPVPSPGPSPTAGVPSSPLPLPNPANSHGAIDPSFTLVGGRPYLLYKTDGKPSTLRAVALTADGQHAVGRSWQLLRSAGVVENPVLLQRGRSWYLFTSEGGYGGCGYRTVWRRSTVPLGSWQGAAAHVLLSHAKQRLCGPGGADVVRTGKRTVLYFHSWTCRGTRRACAAPLNAYSRAEAARRPVRALHGLRLGFTKRGYPRVDRWLRLADARKH